ncbi:ABC transporter ATP-binding protein [Burkholderia sp. MR1-5-21]
MKTLSEVAPINGASRSTAMAKLRVEGLAKQYGAVHALQPTSLSVCDGEFLTLLGPSGSGKTTLLSMVAGLTPPTAGEIWIEGRNVTKEPSSKRGLGMVFQNYALFPHLSIYENIAFPLRMRGISRTEIDAAVRRTLDLVKLPHVADRLPREMSGGQQQRIALARCIVYSPSIILMDEPLGALDKNLREHMQLEIKRLHVELGITVLYVTHDQEEAFAMSDRICLMNNAQIEQIGTPHDLYFRPNTTFTASFLGESNIFPGTLSGSNDDLALHLRQGEVIPIGARANFSSNSTVNWMVRPESIDIRNGGSVKLRANVRNIMFAGGVTRIHLALSDGSMIVAKELTSGRPLPEIGADISVGWSRDDVILLPEGSNS